MSILKKTIGKAGGFATAFLGAVATEHLSHEGGPVLLVLSHLLTHIGSEFIAPIGEEIIEEFKHKKPNELNHDIQRELIESMRNAIDGIEILYKDKYPDNPLTKKTKNFLYKFKKEFFEDFAPEQGYTIEENDLKKIIYTSETKSENRYLFVNDGENKISKLLNERLKEELVKDNIDDKFQNFFLEKFLPLTQFYFGEKLKHDKNGAARRAMERMLSEETLRGINKLIEFQEKSNDEISNQRWLGKVGKLPKKKIDELKGLVKDLNQTKKLEIEFSKALDIRFDELITQNKAINDEINNIKIYLKSINKILFIDRRIAVTIVVLCIAITSVLIYRHINEPFIATFSLSQNPNVSPDYPKLKFPTKLVILLPETPVTIFLNHEKVGISTTINHKWQNRKVPIQLIDDFWQSGVDSILLINKSINIPVKPNNKLELINITVSYLSNKSGSIPIKGAKVQILGFDKDFYTNENGSLKFSVPIGMLKREHKITVSAPEFKPDVESETEYYKPDKGVYAFILKNK